MPQILIIEDDEGLRRMLRLSLEHMGHTVVEAANGREGLKVYHEQPTDLVITDLIMPEQEGIETIIHLSQCQPRPKIIAMSGGGRSTTGDVLIPAKNLGANCTLAKPFSLKELALAIAQLTATATAQE